MAIYGDGKHNENMEYIYDEKKFDNIENLLNEIAYCLNQIPNKKVDSRWFKNTYEICAEINKHI